MTVELILFGLFFIACGITIKKKKWLWIHQGFLKRSVDVAKYSNYMSAIDFITGIVYIAVGVMLYYFKIPPIVIFIILIIYCSFTIYGEVKYRTKSV